MVNANGRASGWALDRDALDRTLEIHLYVDGPAFGGGRSSAAPAPAWRGPTSTRSSAWRAITAGAALPAALFDGQEHRLWAYAFNAGHPGNMVLNRSPLSFTLEVR
ncbi:MAG: hypothetical protein R3F43_20720 [bacterium]